MKRSCSTCLSVSPVHQNNVVQGHLWNMGCVNTTVVTEPLADWAFSLASCIDRLYLLWFHSTGFGACAFMGYV